MLTPSYADLPKLHGLDERGFARWLRVGLEGFFLLGKGRDAFTGVEPYIGQQDHITDDLSSVFRALEPVERVAFQAAIARVLAELDFDVAWDADLAKHLLLLAAKVRARDILPVLPAKLVTAVRLAGDPAGQAFLDMAIDVVLDLAAPTVEAVQALESIILSPAFKPSDSYVALVALCRAARDDLVRHMVLLSQPLNELLGWSFDPTVEAGRHETRCALIAEVFDLVPRAVFFRASEPGWRLSSAPSQRDGELDWWFATLATAEDDRMKRILGEWDRHAPLILEEIETVRIPRFTRVSSSVDVLTEHEGLTTRMIVQQSSSAWRLGATENRTPRDVRVSRDGWALWDLMMGAGIG